MFCIGVLTFPNDLLSLLASGVFVSCGSIRNNLFFQTQPSGYWEIVAYRGVSEERGRGKRGKGEWCARGEREASERRARGERNAKGGRCERGVSEFRARCEGGLSGHSSLGRNEND